MADLDRYLDKMGAADEDLDAHRRLVTATTLLKEVFLNLVKNARTSRLYGPDHHLPRRFLDAFIDHSLDFLREFQLLNVEIEPEAVMYQGHEVLGAAQKGDQLCYGLYSEGLRGISIERSASRRELERLVDILARDWLRRDDEAEDFLAAAWRADFHHVHVDVADRFSDDDDRGQDMTRDELALGGSLAGGDRARALGDSVLVAEVQGLLQELESGDAFGEDIIKMKQDEVQLYLRIRDEMADKVEEGGDEELIALDPGTQAALNREVERVNEGEELPASTAGALWFELTRLATDDDDVEQLGTTLVRHMIVLVEQGRIAEAPSLLQRTLGLLDADLFPGFQRAAAFRRGLAALVGPLYGPRLVTAMRRRSDHEGLAAPIFTLLSSMPEDAIHRMIELGAAAEDCGPLRQVLADAIVTILRHDAQSVYELLVGSSEELAVVPLLAMSRLDYPRAVEHCLLLARSPLPGLREQSLRALRAYQSPNIKAGMIKALDDPTPGVRLEALRYLSVYRDLALLPELEARIRSEWFGELDEEEVKGWLMAFGIIGREQAVPLLRNIALDVAKVHGRPAVVKPMAVRGLKAAGTATAKVALKQVAREQPALRSLLRQLGVGGG